MNQIPSQYIVVRGLLQPIELNLIERLLAAANFEDGAATATDAAKLVKRNLQIPKNGSAEKQQLDAVILRAVSQNVLIQSALLPTRILPPIISKYEPGMHYGMHVDSPIMGDPQVGAIRTDVGMTIFLSDPASYKGGELAVHTQAGTEERYKLERGDAIIYPTTQVHGVLPVTSGVRLAAVTWMQCAIRNPQQREMLQHLKTVQGSLEKQNPQAPENLMLLQVYSNLIRMWAEM
ncbi:MAG: Fe2+-dependent dioxygenase [Saprospiraceae bacterium]|nr:Fe2+-dependent dioxygenase [Saprospiraceae bacterium]